MHALLGRDELGGRGLVLLVEVDLALVEAGRLQVSIEPVNIGEVLRDCLGLMDPLARGAGIRIELADAELDRLVADANVFARTRPEQKQQLIAGATQLLVDVLGKNPAMRHLHFPHLNGLDATDLLAERLLIETGAQRPGTEIIRWRKRLQDVLTAIRLRVPVAQAGRRLQPNGERYLRPIGRLAGPGSSARLSGRSRSAASRCWAPDRASARCRTFSSSRTLPGKA